MSTSVIDDLYRYNDWANGRVFQLCGGLTAAQLDQPRTMGLGSLRATLHHLLAAERIWWERWIGDPWRAFDIDPAGASPDAIERDLSRIAELRRGLIDRERASNWKRVVQYKDSKGNQHANLLDDLLLHVANHGIHHRAQALSYLKGLGRTVPAGLDYIFYRLARPTVAQAPSVADAMRGYGLEINSGPGYEVDWDPQRVRYYFAYHDWAVERLIDKAIPLNAEQLDRPIDIGPGSIRKTLLHLHDAERWWLRNWTTGTSAFERSPLATSLTDLRDAWAQTAERRNRFIADLTAEGSQRIVTVDASGALVSVRVIESLIQLCCHGTHHRAQLLNMLRQVGTQAGELDLIVWVRGRQE